jgi:hypothetical protein
MADEDLRLEESITVPVTRPFKDLVERLAKLDDRKVGQLARRLLERGVKEEAEKHGLPIPASAA